MKCIHCHCTISLSSIPPIANIMDKISENNARKLFPRNLKIHRSTARHTYAYEWTTSTLTMSNCLSLSRSRVSFLSREALPSVLCYSRVHESINQRKKYHLHEKASTLIPPLVPPPASHRHTIFQDSLNTRMILLPYSVVYWKPPLCIQD